MTNKLIEVIEQDAVFDGEPNFMPLSAVINLLNHNAEGGTTKDLLEAKQFGMSNAKLYRVQIHLYVEEL